MSEPRQKVSELIACLQRYLHQTGDDEIEFAFGDTCELGVVKVHEAYEGENERYCEITLDDIESIVN